MASNSLFYSQNYSFCFDSGYFCLLSWLAPLSLLLCPDRFYDLHFIVGERRWEGRSKSPEAMEFTDGERGWRWSFSWRLRLSWEREHGWYVGMGGRETGPVSCTSSPFSETVIQGSHVPLNSHADELFNFSDLSTEYLDNMKPSIEGENLWHGLCCISRREGLSKNIRRELFNSPAY